MIWKKKFLNDKYNKESYLHKKDYCLSFAKNLESLTDPLGHDKREFKKLSINDFFLDDSIEQESDYLCICEKLSSKKIDQYFYEYTDSLEDQQIINKLYLRLKQLDK